MSFSFGASGGGGTGGPSILLIWPHLSSPLLTPLNSPDPGGFSFGGAAPNTTAPAFGAPAATTAATGFSFGAPAASTPGQ